MHGRKNARKYVTEQDFLEKVYSLIENSRDPAFYLTSGLTRKLDCFPPSAMPRKAGVVTVCLQK